MIEQNWQEVKWEREGGIGKGLRVRIRFWDARDATALYVDALPTRISAPKQIILFFMIFAASLSGLCASLMVLYLHVSCDILILCLS